MGNDIDFEKRLREILPERETPLSRPRAALAERRDEFKALEERRKGTDHTDTRRRIEPLVQQTFNNNVNSGRRRPATNNEELEKIAKDLKRQQEELAKSSAKFKHAMNAAKVVEVAKTGLTDDTPAPIKAKFIKRPKGNAQ